MIASTRALITSTYVLNVHCTKAQFSRTEYKIKRVFYNNEAIIFKKILLNLVLHILTRIASGR